MALVCTAVAPRAVWANDNDDAHTEYTKGLGAFALGSYAEAATHYEKAFALKPDPALLYNAAQAQRLAGNKERALLLYSNYIRLFGNRVRNQQEVNRHIVDLKAAIASEDRARTGPPLSTASPSAGDGKAGDSAPPTPIPDDATAATTHTDDPGAIATPVPPAAVAVTVNVDTNPPPKPVYKKGWFWGVVVGGVVVVALGVGLGVGLSGSSNPSAALGVATVR